jgi:hypothetical protein
MNLLAFATHRASIFLGEFVLYLLVLYHALGLIDKLLEVVSGLDLILSLLIRLLVLLSLFDKPLDIFLSESSFLICNCNVRGLSSSFVLGSDLENSVCI